MKRTLYWGLVAACAWGLADCVAIAEPAAADGVMAPASERYASAGVREEPNFQRHVLPLMGRLGCNGRACHGSFQGQGGFRLSLFGYDFQADHDALLKGEEPCVDLKNPRSSLMLTKPTGTDDDHGGGHRLDVDSWQYRVLLRWIEAGAKTIDPERDAHFVRMDVSPLEVEFSAKGQSRQLRVLSHWSDGTVEDVTPLCRFQTNDESVAKISETGLITSTGKGDTHVVAFYDNGVVPVAVMQPVSDQVGSRYPQVPTPTKIDELVVNKLRKLGIVPSEVCSDAEFLRRLSLDMIGTLPSVAEIESFVADTSADKRTRKVDELLARPAFAAWWATKLCDVTGNNERLQSEQVLREERAQLWYRWVVARLTENMPYDKIVEGIVLATSRTSPNQTYADMSLELASYLRKEKPCDFTERETMPFYWTRNNMRTPNEKALSFSYAFLGVRLQCAECHKHPFDQWSQQDFRQFTAFFSRVNYGITKEDNDEYRALMEKYGLKEKNGAEQRKLFVSLISSGKPAPFRELYIQAPKSEEREKGDKNKGKGNEVKSGRVITPKVLGGEEVVAENYSDPRQPLMDWLRDRDNPYFAKAFVNRVWASYFGVGIVDPPDDMNLANAPSNKELLEYLASEFVEHQYDIRWLHRTIVTTRTYQLSWVPNATNEHDSRNFSHALPRRLPAEVVYDAVIDATATEREWTERQADPGSHKAIGAFSGFYQAAGRSRNGYALTVFGKPIRETTCDCERSGEPTLLQTVFLRNDNEMLAMVSRKNGWVSTVTGGPSAERNAETEKADAERRKKLADRVAEYRKYVDKARSKGDKKKLESVEKNLRAAERELAAFNERHPVAEPTTPASVAAAAAATEGLVREAYLRTVSRAPTAVEIASARQYLQQSPDQAEGLRDLVWALLNTKEFIVNH